MKKTILTSLLFLGLLVGCAKPSSSESETPSNSASEVSSEVSSETPSESSSEVPSESSSEVPSESSSEEDSEELPVIPDDSSEGDGSIDSTITINKEIPAGWTYISNNPTQYPNPEYYNDGGLKLNFFPMGLKSPTFEASAKTIVLAGKLNENTKTSTSTTLSIYTVSGTTETLVRSAVFSTKGLKTFSESYSLPAGTTQFVIKLIANGGYNVNLNTITVS